MTPTDLKRDREREGEREREREREREKRGCLNKFYVYFACIFCISRSSVLKAQVSDISDSADVHCN